MTQYSVRTWVTGLFFRTYFCQNCRSFEPPSKADSILYISKSCLSSEQSWKKKLSSPFSHSLGFFREKLLLITLAMHEKLFKMYDTRRRRRPMKSSATLYTKITVVAKTFLPSFRETPGWLSISDGFGHLRSAHAQCPRYTYSHLKVNMHYINSTQSTQLWRLNME